MLAWVAEMKRLEPVADPRALPEASLAVSLLVPAKNSAHALAATVREAHRFCSERFPGNFEIILIPNPGPDPSQDRSTEVARELAREYTGVRVCPHLGISGKGAALRTGFLETRGRWIFFTDADLPYDLEFFDRAAVKLEQGYDLVTGNRRSSASQFEVPVGLLPLAYGRHRLGVGFNRAVRGVLPIQSRDTQAGIKAMTRRLAEASFLAQKCPGFFFDLELFLTAANRGYAQTELPIVLHLNSEKSTVRVLKESVLAGFWLARIALGSLRGYYGTRTVRPAFLGAYPARLFSDPFTWLFLRLRWLQTPYARLARLLPPAGRVLDLGCGHGLLSLEAARARPEREVLGVDHDSGRIALAKTAAQALPNARFAQGGMTPMPEGPFRSMLMIDVLHYFAAETQRRLLLEAFDRLEAGGTLVMREVNPQGGFASFFNRAYERVATGVGFTQSKDGTRHHFRAVSEWTSLLEDCGFRVRTENCGSVLFADVLFICEKPARPT